MATFPVNHACIHINDLWLVQVNGACIHINDLWLVQVNGACMHGDDHSWLVPVNHA